ncbi:MAG: polysaccharide biosynthesis C-terminal domain-containing protein [Clostridiales bacterium]|nr:polysaccharide biosynthesis C-terminal domain-containing protein [Clostridiales bacterium]MDY5514025.1 polysaccharide biosynthesis C-terminal domain-containing protein [Candidatus Ventricola sp.]
MRIRSLVRRLTDNDYVFTIFTKIMAVLIGLIASSYSNRFLGPELKGQLGRISSMLSIVAVTANFGLYQPYPYYKRLGEQDVLDKFLRIFLLQFIAYSVIGVFGAVALESFELTAVCLLAPIQVLANQLSFMIMVEDVKFKNVIFFTARITNTVITILAFYTMDRTILVALALIVVGDLITIVFALLRMRRLPNPLRADLRFAAKIVPFGLISMLTTLMLTLNYRVDTLMMGYMFAVSDTEIGYYTLGVSLSEYGWLIPDAFREVLFSRTAKDDAIGEVTMSMKVNLYLTLLMIAGILVLGRPVIYLLAGAPYLPAYPVTVMLIAGIIPMSYFKIIGTLLLAQGKKMVYLGMLTGSVVVNILCNLVTIPLWGKMGAALSSVVSYTVAGGLFLLYYLRTYQVPLRDVFLFRREELDRLAGMVRRVRQKLARRG